MLTKSMIVSEARSWVGTQFHHQGRLKRTPLHRGGCDCIGLLMGVAKTLNLKRGETMVIDLDRQDYSHQPNGAMLLEYFRQYAQEIPSQDLQPGDVGLFAIDIKDVPQHVAIICDYPQETLGMIHAYAPARAVVEHAFDDLWQKRLIATFQMIEN